MKKNKKSRYFFRLLFVFFIIFASLQVAYESGYYETKAKNKAILTKEAMERFEEDLKKGEMVDVKEYLKEERVDYSNGVTKFGNKISNSLSEVMTKGLSRVFETLKGLFW